MSNIFNEDVSDEEVFFGQLSLKEIKKHILWNNHNNGHTKYKCASSKVDYDTIKIIESHSAPNLNHKDKDVDTNGIKSVPRTSLSPSRPAAYSDWEVKPEDDTFLKVEQMVENLCISPEKVSKKPELNNTLDIIDYILKNGDPKNNGIAKSEPASECVDKMNMKERLKMESNTPTVTSSKFGERLKKEVPHAPSPSSFLTPAKSERKCNKTDKFMTPTTDFKQKTPSFKTPANPLSHKKPSVTSLKKTPNKSNAYQHIASPIASYIKNCPIAPLVKEIRPTKPLPGSSSIPKFVKNSASSKPSNKENVNLPTVAYRSAKKTQVITVPDEDKLPQSQLMKKITSSLPKPLIMKHNHREMNFANRVLGSRQEDSFADLSLRQADVSVCTQKSAFNKPKKPL